MPSAPPPPPSSFAPPRPSSPPSRSSFAPPPPSSPPSRPTAQPPSRSMLDASSYTLSNGSGSSGRSPGHTSPGNKRRVVPIHDLRWKFQDDSQLPKPREWTGVQKRYRAGRGSSVPLDLSAYE
ncbi:hypothetical protein K432DRAFT_81239 [Lepidopterella palustris CBS 459.81]|uniref:Uncharacterized protein n=1 Tax=Lepidopterella palustris CBS 459.81 TaxID=1314670 RepID=A0A8E2DVW6_9PEZI|nr:hypothetical protein K432DRAFT_81239 [Lepidopterella palustris CBS 459.81]